MKLVSQTQVAGLEDQSGAESSRRETGRAPIAICVEDKLQVCRVEIRIGLFGHNGVPASKRSVACYCILCVSHAYAGWILLSLLLALYRDITIQSESSRAGAALVELLDVCFPLCNVSSQIVC